MNFDSLLVAESERASRADRAARSSTSPQSATARRSTSCSTSPSRRTSRRRFTSVLANNDPEAIAWLLPQDTVLLGLADSGAHVSQLCDACFATDLLGNWVRDKEVMPLEHAIHKLIGRAGRGVRSAATAARSRSARRPTSWCSTTTRVAPGPLRRIRDFPADGERLVADKPVGVRHVIVNGTVIREDEQPCAGALEQKPGPLAAVVAAAQSGGSCRAPQAGIGRAHHADRRCRRDLRARRTGHPRTRRTAPAAPCSPRRSCRCRSRRRLRGARP